MHSSLLCPAPVCLSAKLRQPTNSDLPTQVWCPRSSLCTIQASGVRTIHQRHPLCDSLAGQRFTPGAYGQQSPVAE